MFESYRLSRVDQLDLEFDGEIIAEHATEPSNGRWQELRVYRTSTDRWVVERVGCSTRPGEVALPRAYVCETPDDVRLALTFRSRTTRQQYVTSAGVELLHRAAEADPRLEEALAERV
jgi:hypothetical protein